jgi:hypothetical protein
MVTLASAARYAIGATPRGKNGGALQHRQV